MRDADETRKQIEEDAEQDLELENDEGEKVEGGSTPPPAGPVAIPYPNVAR